MSEVLTVEKLKENLEGHEKKFADKIEVLKAEGAALSTENEKVLKALQDGQVAVTASLASLEENVKQKIAAMEVPGMEDEVKTFSLGNMIRGACRSTPGHSMYKANYVDQWKGFEKEKEMIDATVAKSNNTDDGTSGGLLVPVTVRNDLIISLVKPQMPILELGATVITGLQEEIEVPKVTGRPTFQMVGEEEAADASQATYGNFTLRPHMGSSFTKQSNKLIFQTGGQSDKIIMEAIAETMAIGMNNQLLNGTGSNKQVRGLLNQSGFSTNKVSLGTDGRRFKFDDAAKMPTAIKINNERTAIPSSGFLMRPEVSGGLNRQTVKQYSGQAVVDGAPLIGINPLVTDEMLEQSLKAKIRDTTQLSATETRGSSTTSSSVIYADWSKFWIAFFRDLEIRISDTAGDSSGSAFRQNQTWIVAFQEFDCNISRPQAFTKAAGAETDEDNWTS